MLNLYEPFVYSVSTVVLFRVTRSQRSTKRCPVKVTTRFHLELIITPDAEVKGAKQLLKVFGFLFRIIWSHCGKRFIGNSIADERHFE